MLNNKHKKRPAMVVMLILAVLALSAVVFAAPAAMRSIQLNSSASFPVDI